MGKGQSYKDYLDEARLMLNGVKLNTERMATRGITDEKVTLLSNLYNKAHTEDEEQETLKAQLKDKTGSLDETIGELKKVVSEFRKLVKIEMPQNLWREFGIEDKR